MNRIVVLLGIFMYSVADCMLQSIAPSGDQMMGRYIEDSLPGSGVQNGAGDAGKALAYGAKAKIARIVIHKGTYDMAGLARAGYRYGFCGGNIVYEGKCTQPWTEEEDKMLVDALLELHVLGKFVHAHIESDYVNAVHQLIDSDKQYPDNFFSMNSLKHKMATIKDDF